MRTHESHWDTIQKAISKQRLAQALLLVGPLHCNLAAWTTQCIQSIFCKDRCQHCPDCLMINDHAHPDLEWVQAEQTVIKVAQIRELQERAYLTPARGKQRFIVLEGAQMMNKAAGNALLKILEEPPAHTIFILIAAQIGSMLPTLLSRCQRLIFNEEAKDHRANLLLLTQSYPEASPQRDIGQAAVSILEGLIALEEQKEHACTLVAVWTKQFDAAVLLWFLYLVYAQLQQMRFGLVKPEGAYVPQLQRLLSLSQPLVIFSKLDKLTYLQKQIALQIPLNLGLALEDLLL
jgi:DNA polymerase-3 subunit delta'